MNNNFCTVKKAIEDVQIGKPVIIVDNHDRENEGDLMIAAEHANADLLAFMARHARGLMCLPCTSERLERLGIPMMQSNNLDKFATPFANSIDASQNVASGVSVKDRMVTITKFVSETSVPEDFAQPGHLFPLRARAGLLLERQGHTESSIELCLLANTKPVAIIIEIMNEDGTMAKIPDLEEFAKKFDLNIVSIADIFEYKYGSSNSEQEKNG